MQKGRDTHTRLPRSHGSDGTAYRRVAMTTRREGVELFFGPLSHFLAVGRMEASDRLSLLSFCVIFFTSPPSLLFASLHPRAREREFRGAEVFREEFQTVLRFKQSQFDEKVMATSN